MKNNIKVVIFSGGLGTRPSVSESECFNSTINYDISDDKHLFIDTFLEQYLND